MYGVIATILWVIGIYFILLLIYRRKSSLIDVIEYPLLGAMVLLLLFFIVIDPLLNEATLDSVAVLIGPLVIFLVGAFPGLAATYQSKYIRDRKISVLLLAILFFLISSLIVAGMFSALNSLHQ